MPDPHGQATFFDESNDTELGEKPKHRSRRSSLRKTISLITESKRPSTDITSGPLQPSSPRHRRSFSFHRRASASITSIVDYPQSPSQYYNDPEARLKLKMVVASPESFDQALEYGFPSASIMEAIGGTGDESTPKPRGRRHTIESNKHNGALKDRTFFDSSSIDDESHEDLDCAMRATDRTPLPRQRSGHGRSESGEGLTNLGMESDGEDNDSLSDLDSPLTPQSKDGPSVANTLIRQEHYHPQAQNQHHSHSRRRVLSDASWAETQAYEGDKWAAGPREMTLRMTLTRPDLRAPPDARTSSDGRPNGAQEPVSRDPLALEALPAMKAHSALAHASERRVAQGSPVSSGKMRGLWRKVKDRKS